jgi:hypothetical protein
MSTQEEGLPVVVGHPVDDDSRWFVYVIEDWGSATRLPGCEFATRAEAWDWVEANCVPAGQVRH